MNLLRRGTLAVTLAASLFGCDRAKELEEIDKDNRAAILPHYKNASRRMLQDAERLCAGVH